MARISDDDLNQLKRNLSLADLCRSRGIELKRNGRKDLIGKCPFHEDDTPSFVVSPDKNLFHCMGCDAAGSVVDFVMKADGLDFKAAVEKLLALSKVEGLASSGTLHRASDPQSAINNPKSSISPERAGQLLERVVALYTKGFAESPEGRAYLEGRGITDAGLFSRHRVGYANGRLLELLPKDGQLKEELIALGILLASGEERFKECVVFPVFDADGRLTTLYGRRIEAKGQRSEAGDHRSEINQQSAINNPKSSRHFFLPGRVTGLWNAAAAKTYPEVILVESVIDGLSVMMAGHGNVVAIQGANGFTGPVEDELKRLGVCGLTWLLDGDEAGRKATARLKEKLAFSFRCRELRLPDGEDPNSYLVKHGAPALASFMAAARNEQPTTSNPAFKAESGTEPPQVRASGDNVRTPPPPPSSTGNREPGTANCTGNREPGTNNPASHGSAVVACGLRNYRIMGLEKGLRHLKATLRVEHGGKLHVDTLDLFSARARRTLAMDLCRLFEETPETIEADLDKLLRHCEAMPEKQYEIGDMKSQIAEMTAEHRAEAQAFGKSPTLIEEIVADCVKRGLIGERNNVILLYVAMTSRKRETPLSVLILSSSGSGKTALQDAVLAFCPPEDLVKLTSLSGRALFYKDRYSLKNKVLALEEGDGAQEAMYAIRNLISAGELVSESTIKDLATGRLTTMENRVEGPSSVCFTTTKPDVDPETKSRFWVTSIDESRDQTRKILAFQRQLHESDGQITSPEFEAVLRKHRNFQRLLKPVAVKNPFAAQLAYGDDRLQGRRDQPKYLNLIKAIAFLRQLQKPMFGEFRPSTGSGQASGGGPLEYIKVDREDIRLANQLAHELLGHSLDELSRPGRDLLMHLDTLARERHKKLEAESPEAKPQPVAAAGDHLRVGGFSRRDIREFTGWTNTRLHIHLKELVDFEYVIIETGRNGLPFRYRLAWDGQGKDGKRFMLGLTEPEKLV